MASSTIREPRFVHRIGVLAALLVVACTVTTPPPDTPSSAATLEQRLAALPPSPQVETTLARSELLRALGRHDTALTELDAAVAVEREALRWVALGALWRERGAVYLELDQPQQALESFAERLKSAVSLDDHLARASSLVDTAYAFAQLGLVGRADEALTEARLIGGEELLADPLAAERMGLTAMLLEDPERAAGLLTRARDGYGQRADRNGAARAAVYVAQLVAREQRQDQALLAVEPEVSAAWDPAARALWLRYRAEAALARPDPAACAQHARESIALADARRLLPTAKLARVTLARCAAKTGELEAAVRAAEEAASLAEDRYAQLSGERARQEAGFEAFQIYRLLLELQLELPEAQRAEAVFATAERARARAHLDAVARARTGLVGGGAIDPVLATEQREREEAVRQLTQQLTSARADPRLAERHRDALWALADVREEIQQQSTLVQRIRLPPPVNLARVRETLLREGGVVLAYFMGESAGVLIAISRDQARVVRLTAPPAQLATEVRALRGLLRTPNSDPATVRGAAGKLHATLLGPVTELVQKHERLIVIPHGAIASLPFEALVDAQGKYLLEHHVVSYALSATLAAELDSAPPAAGRVAFVGMGDPVYELTPAGAGAPTAAARGLELFLAAKAVTPGTGAAANADSALARIPGTGREVRAIAALFGRDQRTYLREQASETAVKAGALKGARIVHIASHGLLEPHYQALVLTLDPKSPDDGFLLTDELVALELDSDLVVLSACNTGSTHQRGGEPVAGLALALRAAGARRVMLSLWPVDDTATADLMTAFYGPLVKASAGYDTALTAAKRKLLAGPKAHPFYWAPFVLFGG